MEKGERASERARERGKRERDKGDGEEEDKRGDKCLMEDQLSGVVGEEQLGRCCFLSVFMEIAASCHQR